MEEEKNFFDEYEISFQGKVRNLYEINDKLLLIIATDRISAFDFVFNDEIQGKGIILNKLTKFWFNKTNQIINNHLESDQKIKELKIPKTDIDRCMVVKKTKVIPIEAIVRGYLAGSAWKEYKETNKIHGTTAEKNLSKYDKFEQPIFTPSTTSAVGDKDINISFEKMENNIGKSLANTIKETSLKLYNFAHEFAKNKGIIIADTKFEYGIDDEDNLILIDEIFTTDSSRFWIYNNDTEQINHESFDKQFFRDYLISIGWQNEQIEIPLEIKNKLMDKYNLALRLLTS